MVAKFCSVSDSDRVYDKWKAGDQINFENDVLRKIIKPDPMHFRNLWKITSKYSHGTIYSQQISFDWDYLLPEIEINLSLLEIFLHFHCHLLVSHVMQPSLRYYLRYFDKGEIQNIKEKV
jgi:hypothetical protein